MIVQAPDERLTTPSTTTSLEEAPELISRLLEAYAELPEATRVGLAAVQIGVNKNAALVMGRPMINLWSMVSEKKVLGSEGCYSIENASIHFSKNRAKFILARWQDPWTGETKVERMDGLQARVFQHELDHINGLLCNA